MGVIPCGAGGGDGQMVLGQELIPVVVDGDVIGGIVSANAQNFVSELRLLKTVGLAGADHKLRIDPTAEIAYMPPQADHGGAYPGVYIFTDPGRMIRPVLHLATRRVEWIGPMEQVYLEIACLADDIRDDTTHAELSPTVMLSQIASLTPFSDYNQSPRNMYQCQMGKQTMGTPAHALRHRSDNKLYRIQTAQAPIVQTQTQRDYAMDEYPQGANAVVAVISYTGYDMEDAMIINKASYERGFGHGSVYKTIIIDLEEEEKKMIRDGARPTLRFGNLKPVGDIAYATKFHEGLDVDGLPMEGEVIEGGEPLCCFIDDISGDHKVVKHKDNERAFVDTVRVLGNSSDTVNRGGAKDTATLKKVSITLRYRRNPIIGDKFSSRHGQKGTLSVLWPQENMPFSESGICPDVLINPHAFPSRMTIGMLIESMAGKSGALHGIYQDSTPFQFHEKNRVIDYFGEQLKTAGYHYYGSEPLYCGISGKLMQTDIFIGLVFYQRLRHMVSDKFQARSTGSVMAITRQPVKGRKRHGGIRLGEMERDALLSHGVSFCVRDRLMNCSDAHIAYVCGECGGLLNVMAQVAKNELGGVHGLGGTKGSFQKKQTCRTCQSSKSVRPIQLPYVFRYLANELAGMGIKMSMKLTE
jgi:DNA-directed RNA polymerase I subunit RPA2